MVPRSIAALFVAPAVLLSACSSSSSSGDSGAAATPIPLGQVPALLAQTECDVINQCFGPASPFIVGKGDCLAHQTKVVQSSGFAADQSLIDSKKLTYDGTEVQACVDAIEAAGCNFLDNTTPDVCKKVFVGTTATGGQCTEDSECADDGACVGHGTCPGTCTARVAAGSPCARNEQCVAGLLCAGDGTGQNQKCVAPAAQGQACNQGMPPCGGGTVCVGADSKKMTPGTCKMPADAFTKNLGDACDPAGSFCVSGAFCALTGVSASDITYLCVGPSTMGGACKLAFPESCPSGQYCNADPTMMKLDGTCADIPADGDVCGGYSQVCKPESTCVVSGMTKTCRPLQDIGGACSGPAECYSNTCTNGACVAQTSCTRP